MKVIIKESDCCHLKGLSVYNSNYYRLPFLVNGVQILYEHYDGGENFDGCSIGELIKNKYVPRYYLHTESNEACFIFDSEEISKENRWT